MMHTGSVGHQIAMENIFIETEIIVATLWQSSTETEPVSAENFREMWTWEEHSRTPLQ